MPVHAHNLKNLSKGDSAKRKPLRSGSNDSDWSANKTRTKILTTRVQTGPRPSPDHMVLKRQTCFNCGTPGHIARNCPHRPYVPYYAQNWQNVPRRKSSKRGHFSRSRSSDGDWNADKAKNQASRDITNMKHDSRDAFTKSKWVRSKSYQGSSSSSHLKFKPKCLITDGFPKSLPPNHLTVLLLLHVLYLTNRICHGKEYHVLTVMANPVTKWTGLQNSTNPAASAGAATEEYHQTLVC